MMYMETSAYNASNVGPAFERLLTEIYNMESSKHRSPGSNSWRRPLKMIDRHLFDI
jgi:hypothetical protein